MTARAGIPIDMLQEGGDGGQMGWWAKGHYPSEQFAREVEAFAAEWNANPDWMDDDEPQPGRVRIPVTSVYRTWWRCVPINDGEGYYEYRVARPRSRGAFAVTVTEHHPSVGFDGLSRRRFHGSTWCHCRACRAKSQHRYDEMNRLRERADLLGQWRAAAHPERYRHDVVLHSGGDGSFPCYYVAWEDLDAPHVRSFLERIGHAAPTRPEAEVIQHVA